MAKWVALTHKCVSVALTRRLLIGQHYRNHHQSALAAVYSSILNDQNILHVDNLSLPKLIKLEPYQFVKALYDLVKEDNAGKEASTNLFNRCIEKLTRYDFAVATIGLKKLENLDANLTSNSMIELIKWNPGRVNTSWELFIKYGVSLNENRDSILLETLKKQLYFDKAVLEEGEKRLNSSDVAKCIYLIDAIRDKSVINESITSHFVEVIIEGKFTCILPYLLESVDFNLASLGSVAQDMSPLQIYYIAKHFDFDSVHSISPLFDKVMATLGTINLIEPLPEEVTHFNDLKTDLKSLKALAGGVREWHDSLIMKAEDTSTLFYSYVSEIEHKCCRDKYYSLNRAILRYLGCYKSDLGSFNRLHTLCCSVYPKHMNELDFEKFLTFSMMGYQNNDRPMIKKAQKLYSRSYGKSVFIQMTQVCILVFSKFDIDLSLTIYNDGINLASDEIISSRNFTEKEALLLCLIQSYLNNGDLDFARLLFENAVQLKILKTEVAKKELKQMLRSMYESDDRLKPKSQLELDTINYMRAI